MLALTLLLIAQPIAIDWNDTPNQYWIGPDWHANRLQDWQVKDNRIICTEVSDRLPMRTLHLLHSRTMFLQPTVALLQALTTTELYFYGITQFPLEEQRCGLLAKRLLQVMCRVFHRIQQLEMALNTAEYQ